MSILQKVGCAAVCILLFVGAIIGTVFYATSGIADTADEFFAATNADDYDTAYGLTSQRLQGSGSPEALKSFMEQAGISEVTDTSWSSRSMQNNTGELSGTVTTGSGGTVPLTLLFVSENDEWKIDGFDIKGGTMSNGSTSAAEPMVVPPISAQKKLIVNATNGLSNALTSGDFSEWKASWVDSMTVEQLEEGFGQMRESEAEIRGIVSDYEPRFEPATSINEKGYMDVKGHYERDDGLRLNFEYSFYGSGKETPKLVIAEYE